MMRERIDTETLFQTALKVFARYGYRNTSVEDIAAELDMTKGNLYLYVENKQDLYRKTVAYALTRWQEKVARDVAAQGDPRKQFDVMCVKAVNYLAGDADLRNILVHDPDIFPLFDENDPYREINRRSEEMIRTILVRGMKAKVFRKVDAEKTARVIFSIYKFIIIRMYIRPEGEGAREMFDQSLDLFSRGLFRE